MHRLVKLAAIVFAVLIALLGALTLVVRSQVDPEKLKARIEAEATKALGRTVKVGSVSASWGAAVSITELSILDAEGKAPQVTLGSARVAIALSALFKGEVRLDSVSLSGLTVRAKRLADGTLDSADVLARLGGGAAGAGQAGAGAPVVVSFSDTTLALEDASGVLPAKLTWSGVSGSINSGEEIAIALSGALAAGDAPLASKLLVKADYRLAAGEGKLAVTARGLQLERVRALVPALKASGAQGEAEVTATVALARTTPSLASLSLGLKDVKITGAPMPAPVEGLTGEIVYSGTAVELSGLGLNAMGTRLSVPKGKLAIKPGGVQADELHIVVGELPIACSVNLSGWPAAPQLALRVSATDADLAKLAPQLAGRARIDAMLSGPLAQLAATGQIQVLAPVKVPLPPAAGGAPLTIASGTFALNGRDLATTDLACQAFGVTCRPRLSILSLMSAPQIALDTGAMMIDLSKLAGSLPADAAAFVQTLAPQGQMKVALRAAGSLAAPRLSGAVEPEGVSLELPGTGRRVTLQRGRVDIAGTRATIVGITLVHEGLAVQVAGGVENLVGTPRVSLDVSGKNVPVERIAGLVPAEARAQIEAYHVKGQVDVDALIAGAPGAIRADAKIGLKGFELVAPVGERRVAVKINSGIIEVTPDALKLSGIDGLADGKIVFGASGSIAKYLTEPVLDVTAVARGLTIEALRGFLPDAALAEVNKRRVQLAFDARAHVKGTKAAPQVVVRALPTAGSVPLPIPGKNLTATLSPGGEVGMEDGAIVITGLPVTVAQNTVKISGRIEDPQGAQKLDLKIAGQGINLAGLAPYMPEAAKRALAQAGFKGGRGIVATVKGTPAEPQIDAQVDLAGSEFASLPGLGAGRIPSGALKLAGNAVVLDKLVFEVGGVPIDVAGKVTMAAEPQLGLTVRGDRIDLASLSRAMPLPAGTSLDGTTKLDVKIEGSPSAPRINGRVGLTGVGIRTAGFAQPLRGESGELVLAGDDIVIQDAAFRAGASRVTARGKVARFTSDAVCEGIEVSGPVDLADVAGKMGIALAGKGTVTARASGPARDPKMDGTLSLPSGTYTMPSGVAIALKDILADFARGPTQLKVTKLQGWIAGGQIAASGVVNNPGPEQNAVFQMQLVGAQLDQIVPRGENGLAGKIDLAFNGNGASVASLTGNGQVKVDGLIVDLTRNAQLKSYGKYAQGAKVATLAGVLFTKGKDQDRAKGFDQEVSFYNTVLKEAKGRHEMGTISSPLAIAGGVARMEPIQGEKITGRVLLGIATGQVSGRIDKLALGRVGMQIELAGTLSAPAPDIKREAITVDGKTLAQLKSEQSPAEATADASATEAPKSKKQQVIDALLGGNAGGEEAAEAPAEAPAQPKKKKKVGALLLDALKGAGDEPAEAPAAEAAEAPAAEAPAAEAPAAAEAAPAEAAPAPAPKKKKKVLNLLLENLR